MRVDLDNSIFADWVGAYAATLMPVVEEALTKDIKLYARHLPGTLTRSGVRVTSARLFNASS
jgi:hypothetical protein